MTLEGESKTNRTKGYHDEYDEEVSKPVLELWSAAYVKTRRNVNTESSRT